MPGLIFSWQLTHSWLSLVDMTSSLSAFDPCAPWQDWQISS